MSRLDIFQKVETICHRIFGEETLITEATASTDIDKWDSMNHVLLIAAIENKFAVKFDIMEIIEINTIGHFINLIEKKQN